MGPPVASCWVPSNGSFDRRVFSPVAKVCGRSLSGGQRERSQGGPCSLSRCARVATGGIAWRTAGMDPIGMSVCAAPLAVSIATTRDRRGVRVPWSGSGIEAAQAADCSALTSSRRSTTRGSGVVIEAVVRPARTGTALPGASCWGARTRSPHGWGRESSTADDYQIETLLARQGCEVPIGRCTDSPPNGAPSAGRTHRLHCRRRSGKLPLSPSVLTWQFRRQGRCSMTGWGLIELRFGAHEHLSWLWAAFLATRRLRWLQHRRKVL